MGLSKQDAINIRSSITDAFMKVSSTSDINAVGLGRAVKSPEGGDYIVAVMSPNKISEQRKQEIRDCAADILKRQPTDKELIFKVIGRIGVGL